MEDQDLWQKLKEGDKFALESIYREHLNHLINYGRRFTAREDLVEDCIQELFVELWQKRQNLSNTDHIKPYLLVSIRRKIISKLKKQAKHSTERESGEYFSAELSIENHLINKEVKKEKAEAIANAMKNLSERQQEIVYLKYFANLEYDEIADIMDLNYQSARNLLSRAIKKLSKHFIIVLALLGILRFNFSYFLIEN